jgi:DNA-binding protein H-NS
MRKPRDFDAELQALNEKAKQLKERKLHQLGDLVVATGADALPIEQLAGALLDAVDTKDAGTKEGWRRRGAAFFQAASRGPRCADQNDGRPTSSARGATSATGGDRAR